ncbi:hypothetical protein G9F72_019245 [Clostridium estertheticum]|uniref:hypothetical protein n=1 Tax=Clostridium estertheticum TaxID=238834 RepID=UPI0013E97E45|nr:hypothetical protein [Clostridium estertheticum]MBZ9688469.1 hypothetical protein [Clostridium estertheticum]
MKKPPCRLVGENGNIFNLLSIASKALKTEGLYAESKEMVERVRSCNSYDEALSIIMMYVEVE